MRLKLLHAILVLSEISHPIRDITKYETPPDEHWRHQKFFNIFLFSILNISKGNSAQGTYALNVLL